MPPYTGGSGDTVFGVPIYGNTYYNEPWFRLTFRAYHSFLRRVDNVYFWFVYRFRRRYHIVNTGLEPGYRDVDDLMFHACFALLGRFVEKELGPFRLNNKYHCEEAHYRGYRLHSTGDDNKKAVDLWLWYKHELPEIERLYAEDLEACYGGDTLKFGETDERGFREAIITPRAERKYPYDWPEIVKDEKLRELIDMRRSLWT